MDPDMPRPLRVLLVEDNPADARLMEEALREAEGEVELHTVPDGEAALDFLHHREHHVRAPRPHIVLLDLNLPLKKGHEVLEQMKSDPELRDIPVVILTTSAEEADIRRSYDLQAASFVTKPVDVDSFFEVVERLQDYWSGVSRVPSDTGRTAGG